MKGEERRRHMSAVFKFLCVYYWRHGTERSSEQCDLVERKMCCVSGCTIATDGLGTNRHCKRSLRYGGLWTHSHCPRSIILISHTPTIKLNWQHLLSLPCSTAVKLNRMYLFSTVYKPHSPFALSQIVPRRHAQLSSTHLRTGHMLPTLLVPDFRQFSANIIVGLGDMANISYPDFFMGVSWSWFYYKL